MVAEFVVSDLSLLEITFSKFKKTKNKIEKWIWKKVESFLSILVPHQLIIS
tara:strand:+ start:866 stop:1018 length:153 start_codon:yes stop_codon:yes gene_type:complete